MTVAVFVQRTRTPPPSPPRGVFRGVQSTWTGHDGRVWDLTNPGSGVVLLEGPVEGLLNVPAERFRSASASRAGSRWRGSRDLDRPVFWPLGIYSDTSSEDWLATDRAFWQSMDRDRPGVWRVETPDGRARSLRCRFEDDGGVLAGGRDPVAAGWAVYEVSLVADEEPYWLGDPVVESYTIGAPEERPFIDPVQGAPPFYVTQPSTLATAAITNPGDVEAFPVFTVTNEATGVVLGVGTDLIGVNVNLGVGDELVIDTAAQSATLNGVRVRGILNPHEFAPIPPRSSIPLNFAATGSGVIEVAIMPRFKRAW